MKIKIILILLAYFFSYTIAIAQLKKATCIAVWSPKQARDSSLSWLNGSSDLKKWEKSFLKILLNPVLQFKNKMSIYRIEYETIGVRREKVTASGAVFIPQIVDSMPIMVYEHGTAYHKLDVPSFLRSTGNRMECMYPLSLTDKGFITIAPDYIGWGTGTGKFAYIEAKTEARCSIDMIRASKQLLDSLKINIKKETYFYGFSQGAHAAMATAREIHVNCPNEFYIKGLIVSSGGYDIYQAIKGAMENKMVFFDPEAGNNLLLLLAGGHNEMGNIYNNKKDIVISEYEEIYEKYIENLGGDLMFSLPNDWTKVIKPEYFKAVLENDNHPFWQFLRQNNVGNWENPYLTYFFYSMQDKQVPYSCSLDAISSQKRLYKEKNNKYATHLQQSNLGIWGRIKIPNNMTHRFFSIPSILKAQRIFVKLKDKKH